MTIEKEMQLTRYIRAYHKQTGILAFEVLLPSDCLTFLSTVDFLQNDDDPLLYYCYELTQEQTDFIFGHWHLLYETDTDYFDYSLECDRVVENKVKTKEELLYYYQDYNQFADIEDCIRVLRPSLLHVFQDLCYTIYQQGVTDGRL